MPVESAADERDNLNQTAPLVSLCQQMFSDYIVNISVLNDVYTNPKVWSQVEGSFAWGDSLYSLLNEEISAE